MGIPRIRSCSGAVSIRSAQTYTIRGGFIGKNEGGSQVRVTPMDEDPIPTSYPS
jgi:hypothetical protein